MIRFYKGDSDKTSPVGKYYEGLVNQHPNVVFLDANLNRNMHAVGEMAVTSVPTFIAFKNHREVGRYSGTDEQQVLKLITLNA